MNSSQLLQQLQSTHQVQIGISPPYPMLLFYFVCSHLTVLSAGVLIVFCVCSSVQCPLSPSPVARDYVGASFTVPFLAGIVRSHQSIRIVQDNATEGRESFSLVLNITREGTQLGVVPGDIVMTTIWIIDSDDRK